MMQNKGGGSCGQSMQLEAYSVCQQDGQNESFKPGITGEVEIPQQASEQVVDGIGKLRARGDGNRRDMAINKTMLKWNHFKHGCIKKEVLVEQSCGESS